MSHAVASHSAAPKPSAAEHQRREGARPKERKATSCRRASRLGPRTPSLFSLVAHELGAERALRRVLVVGGAPESDPIHRRLTPKCHRVDVIELQEGARRATLTGRTDESA